MNSCKKVIICCITLVLNISCQKIHELLRKDTDEVIQNNVVLWDRIQNTNITDIYSYGFSFGDVNHVYIVKMCKLLDTKSVVWHMHDFDKAKFQKYEDCLKQSGFQRGLKLFSVEK